MSELGALEVTPIPLFNSANTWVWVVEEIVRGGGVILDEFKLEVDARAFVSRLEASFRTVKTGAQ